MSISILFIGDIVGKPGRMAVSRELHRLVDRYNVDLVIANGENAAGGFGLTQETATELFSQGIHLLTGGNHIWDKKEAIGYIGREERILRPANYPGCTVGRGSTVLVTPGGVKVAVLNLEGRVFMKNLECPFLVADRELALLREETPIVIVDFHAEATSEKAAFAHYLDGRASCILGTHTHVQTADERILAGGTAFITDVGMTGSFDSVIGMGKEETIRKFLTQIPIKFEVGKKDIRLNALAVSIDETSGKALKVERIAVQC